MEYKVKCWGIEQETPPKEIYKSREFLEIFEKFEGDLLFNPGKNLPGLCILANSAQAPGGNNNESIFKFFQENGLHLMEAPSCLISVATFLSAMSLCLNCSSCLSCKLTRSVLKARESEENLFSMSRSDKLPALERRRSQNLDNMDHLAQLGTTWHKTYSRAMFSMSPRS